MKIAVAVDGNSVSEHFGHCEGFKLYEVENKEIKSQDFIPNPGHKPGFLPRFLSEKGVNVIIAGGMGTTAQVLFNQNTIEVITGASGVPNDVIREYISGNLESTNEACEGHGHYGDCNK
jgi:predicted Fe-Mo cluster-binding NifX family protein